VSEIEASIGGLCCGVEALILTVEQGCLMMGNYCATHTRQDPAALFAKTCVDRVYQVEVALSLTRETIVQLNAFRHDPVNRLNLVLPKAAEPGQWATLRYITDESGNFYITEKSLGSSHNGGSGCADPKDVGTAADRGIHAVETERVAVQNSLVLAPESSIKTVSD
jgi:hypothetical protein